MAHKSRKKLRNFMFLIAGCSLLRAEGFFCNLDVLYGALGIGIFVVFDPNIFFFSCKFFQFLVIKTLDPDLIRIGISLKCWVRIRIK